MDIKKWGEMASELDVARITEHIEWLTRETPYRISSGQDVVKASSYVCSQLAEFGLDVRRERFYTYNSTPISSSIEVISPVSETFRSLPCGHIRSTAPEGEEHRLLYLTTEDYANIDDIDLRGHVILAEMSYAPPVPEKARLLSEHGAAGMICMNWGNDEDVICNRAIKTVWGNPTEETFPKIPNLIAIGVTHNAGLRLKSLCQNCDVRIRISARGDNLWQEVEMPFGILRGNGRTKEFLLVASHLDAWQPGVTCNATGNGLTLELCRVLAAHRKDLDRDIWVVFWNGHEIAESAGSTWFVDNYWDALERGCVNYMHIDSPGLKDSTLYEIKCADELMKFAEANVREIADIDIRVMSLRKIGDMSCLGLGIPGVCQRMSYTQDYMDRNNGATLGWWNHTDQDGLDKYAPVVMEKDAKFTLSFLYDLATVEYLPYDFTAKFTNLITVMQGLQEQHGEHIDLRDAIVSLEEAKRLVLDIQNSKGNGDREAYNRFMMHVSHCMTNVSQTYASKYEQDSYGYYKLSHQLPLLADIGRLAKLDPASLEYGLVKTQLVRNRNRIDDAAASVAYAATLYNRRDG